MRYLLIGLLGLGTIVALGAVPVQAQTGWTTGIVINRAGAVLVDADTISTCAATEVDGAALAFTAQADARNGLALLQFDGLRATPLALSPARLLPGEAVTLAGFRPGAQRTELAATQAFITDPLGEDGDTLTFAIRADGGPRLESPAALDRSGNVLGVASGRHKRGDGTDVTRAAFIAMFLTTRGVDFTTARPGADLRNTGRIRDAAASGLVRVACLDEEALEARNTPPSFNEDTLARFGPETWARAFAETYHEVWSSPNEAALDFIAQVYRGDVTYFGKRTPVAEVRRDKVNFASRWPNRSYTMRPDTLAITCAAGTCTVEGVNDWFVWSPDRNDARSGVARFSIDLDLRTLAITRETSSVVSRGDGDPTLMIERWEARNRACETDARAGACLSRDYAETSLRAAGLCVKRGRPTGTRADLYRCR